MIVLRSLIFNILFYVVLVLFLVLCSPVLLMPRIYAIRALQAWGRVSNWLLEKICNIKVEVRGAQNIPPGPLLVAGKHQSAWETFAVPPLLDDPCMVEKKELFYIPIYGWPYTYKFRMIGVDRSGGSKSLKDLIARGREEIARGRQIVILPEGTRRPVGAPPDYKPGAAALYAGLNVPCVPFGLNAGQCWPRRSFLRRPGTITIEFGPVIPAGLPRKEFQVRLQDAIESITNRLVAENRS
ncbi:MAG: 1-acyl-sn-glycerol-3-phosphate acyltransferase [Alphaproteobacteria bacterium]|nr:1-acyl-sn-glycerol-3-phosphate acyltransferase [Alphaproteobacteria bacterium]